MGNMSQTDLPPELRFADKPTLNFKFFVLALLENYETGHANLHYGFVLYDWLDKRNLIKITPDEKKEAFKEAKNNVNNAKSIIIDNMFKTNKLNPTELKLTLKNLNDE